MALGRQVSDKLALVVEVVSDKAETALRKLGSDTEKVGDQSEATGSKFSGLFDKFTTKFPAAGRAASKFGIDAGTAGAMAGTAATAAATAVGAFAVKSVQAYQEVAGQILQFQRVSGTTAEEASRWVEVAGDYGVGSDQMGAAIGRLAKQAADAPDKLAALGVQVARNADGGVDLEKTMLRAAEAFRTQTDDAKRAELGMALFGKSWQQLVPLLVQGSDGLAKSLEGVSDAKILSDEDLKQAEEFRLAMDDLKGVSEDLMIQVGRGLVPALKDLADAAKNVDAAFRPIGGFKTVVSAMTAPVRQVSGAIEGLTTGFGLWGDSADEATDKAGTWNDEMDRSAEVAGENAKLNAVLAQSFEDTAAAQKLAAEEAEVQADRLEELADAMDDADKSAKDYLQTTKDLYLASLDYDELLETFPEKIDELREAHEEVTRAEREHGAGSDQLREAHLRQAAAIRDIQRTLPQVAAEALKLAEAQAALEGKTLTADQAMQVQKQALLQFAQTFPEVKQAVDDFMNRGLDPLAEKARDTAGTIVTNAQKIIDAWRDAAGQITITADEADRRLGGGSRTAPTSGGGSTGGGAGRGYVNSLNGFGGAPAAAGIVINVSSLDPRGAGQAVIDAIAAYERTNGKGWRS